MSRGDRKLAGAHPPGQALSDLDRAIFAVNGDEFAKSGAKRSVRASVDIDAVKQRLGERLAHISERGVARLCGGKLFE